MHYSEWDWGMECKPLCTLREDDGEQEVREGGVASLREEAAWSTPLSRWFSTLGPTA